LNALHEQPMNLCARCGEALDMDSARFAGQFAEGLLCSPCRITPPEFHRAVAYGIYEDELRLMIHMLKYEGVRAVARPLGRRLAHEIAKLESVAARDLLVVPVPLFAAKQRQRGYNQAQLLADAAMEELRKTSPAWKLIAEYRALRRVKNTESQFGLTPRARRRNLQGAFAVVEAEAIRGREVLLIDDIYTTGATARECARVLRRAGAGKVWVATVARAQHPAVAVWTQKSKAHSLEPSSLRTEFSREDQD